MKLQVKIKALFLVALLAFGGTLAIHTVGAASPNQVYVSPASSSVKNGSNVTVAVRINPSSSVSGVQFTLSFNSAKLQYVSEDNSGSPFTVKLQDTPAASSLTFSSGLFSSGVTTDSLVDNVTFKALVGTGTDTFALSNVNATSYTSPGTYTNPSPANGTVSFTTPACAAGQTGTYPNCVTPAPPSGGGGTTTPPSSGGGTTTAPKSGGSTSTGTKSSGSTSTSSSGSTSGGSAGGATITSVNADPAKVQYTLADVTLATNKPTQVYIKYGLTTSLGISTPLSALATSHDVSLDPALLIPGTTYYYTVVAKDQSGTVTQTDVKSFTTKGYTIHVILVDKNGKPLKGANVTLHSTPTTAKTDDKGVAVFTNIAPGAHHIEYLDGKKQYSQPVTVTNSVTTDNSTGIQSAPVQNLSVQLPVTPHQAPIVPVVIILLLAVIVAAVVLFRDRLKALLMPSHPAMAAATVAVGPTVVSSSTDPMDNNAQPVQPVAGQPTMTDRLNKLPDASTPNPGTLIRPQDDNNPKV